MRLLSPGSIWFEKAEAIAQVILTWQKCPCQVSAYHLHLWEVFKPMSPASLRLRGLADTRSKMLDIENWKLFLGPGVCPPNQLVKPTCCLFFALISKSNRSFDFYMWSLHFTFHVRIFQNCFHLRRLAPSGLPGETSAVKKKKMAEEVPKTENLKDSNREEKPKSSRDLIWECFQKVRVSAPQPARVFVASRSLPESVLRNHCRCLRWLRIKTLETGWAKSMVTAVSLKGSWTVWSFKGLQMKSAGIILPLAFRWSRTVRSTSSMWSWISWTTALMPSTDVPRCFVIFMFCKNHSLWMCPSCFFSLLQVLLCN